MTQAIFRPDRTAGDGHLQFLSGLGKGRAAEVHLVRDLETNLLYAEKVFKPRQSSAELTRDIIYWICFQAPFPYNSKEDAIRACVFRRKVLRDLSEFWFGKPLVADGFYSCWDENSRGYIIGSEYIRGRGPRPGLPDPYTFRNLLFHYPLDLCKRMTGFSPANRNPVRWEIDDVVVHLDKLKEHFHEAGFVGSEWQVDKGLSVPTSNLLIDNDGELMLVDIESGMPAILFPRYLWVAFRTGLLPLFDDVDFPTLHKYVSDNHTSIQNCLGTQRTVELNDYIDQLQYHTEKWKSSEPAIYRHRHRLITDSGLRSSIRKSFADYWYKQGRISAKKADRIESSSLHFMLCWHWDFFRNGLQAISIILRSLYRFISSFAKSAKTSLRVLWSAFFNDKYLQEFAELYVNERITSWQLAERLTEDEITRLREPTRSPNVAEYLKGFMVHLGLNLLEPPFIGNIIVAALAITLDQLWILLFFFMGPILRTIYTLVRMIQNRGSGVPYSTALLIGAIPKIGTMAYPIQMSASHPNLSRFLARWQLSNFACHIPFFGAVDSRLEHFFIRTADFGPSIQYEITGIIQKLKSLIFKALRRPGSSHSEEG